MSGDPLVQDATNGQSYNRYSYVLNNPTNLTDPTGFASTVIVTGNKLSEPNMAGNMAGFILGTSVVGGTNKNIVVRAVNLVGKVSVLGSRIPVTVKIPAYLIVTATDDETSSDSAISGFAAAKGAAPTDGSELGRSMTRERPDVVSDGVSINQSTGEATAVRVDTGNQTSDAIQNGLAPVKAGTWNAFRAIGKWWSELSLLAMGGVSGYGGATAPLVTYSSARHALGNGYAAVGEVTATVKNQGLLNALSKSGPGTWEKVYEAGVMKGQQIEVHYFRNSSSGRVFDVKIKYENWHQKEFRNLGQP